MRVIRILAVVAVAATFGLAAGCGGDDDDDEGAGTDATTTEEAVGGGGDVIEVSMTEYAFKPKDLTVSKEDRIVVKNDGELVHNYSIKGGGKEIGPSTQNIDPGSSGELFPEPADFICGGCEVICTIPGHAEKGMRGTLTVRKG